MTSKPAKATTENKGAKKMARRRSKPDSPTLLAKYDNDGEHGANEQPSAKPESTETGTAVVEAKKRNVGGRPTSYVEPVVSEILKRLASGEDLVHICKDEHLPVMSTVMLWAADDRDGFSERYNRARRAWSKAQAEKLVNIADDSEFDTIVDPNTGRERPNTEWVARSKLRIETRRWLMSKYDPAQFGDRQTIEQTGPNGGPVQLQAIPTDPIQAASAYQQMIQGPNGSGGS